MWFVPKESDNRIGIGRCRKHAPTLQGWPAVFVGDWCGDHKLDENARAQPTADEIEERRSRQGVDW